MVIDRIPAKNARPPPERCLQLARPRRKAVKCLVLAFALVGAASSGFAQQLPEPAAQAPVFRSDASLVALNVSVTDSGKKFVSGLTLDDFAVFEDGVRQQVSFFEATQVPIDLILLLDTSSSMLDKIDSVHQAAIGFLKTLRSSDRGAVVAFNDGVDVLQALTSDRVALERAVMSTRAKGGTALNNALYVALKQFGRGARDTGEVRRQAIAVLSDGEDTSSLISFDDVVEVARRTGVGIYAIGLSSRDKAAAAHTANGSLYFSPSQYALKTLAQESGGGAFFPGQIAELRGVYDAIARELSSQYSLGYAPTNAAQDGHFRRIVVQVPSRPELRPKARAGYTAADTIRAAHSGQKE
jgi:Ca-activated chloride channel homolog